MARLRPLTAAQSAQSISQPRLLAIEGGLRTFKPARRLNTSVAAEPFLNGTSSNYVEEMYYAWLENPRNVHKVRYSLCLICSHKTGSGQVYYSLGPLHFPSDRPDNKCFSMFTDTCPAVSRVKVSVDTSGVCLCICLACLTSQEPQQRAIVQKVNDTQRRKKHTL